MTPPKISRRALLAAAALSPACRAPKATGIVGFCFVANHDSRSVSAVDLSRFRLRAHVPLDAAPDEVVSPPKSGRAYVLARDGATIFEIDAISLSVSRRLRVGNIAVSMRLAPTGDAIWVLTRDPAALVEVPLATLRTGRRIKLANPPDSFELSRQTPAACIVTRQDRTVAIAALDQASLARTIASQAEPSIACFRSDGRYVLAGSDTARNLTIYETGTGKTVVVLPLGVAPRHFCTTGDGGQLYITGEGMDAVVTVYPYQTEVAETRLAGHAPGAMAVAEPTPGTPALLLVANPADDRVTVLDVETGNLAAIVEVGRHPSGILITPDGQFALVVNEGSGDLAVVRVVAMAGRQEAGARVKRYKSAPIFTMVGVGERPTGAAVVTFS